MPVAGAAAPMLETEKCLQLSSSAAQLLQKQTHTTTHLIDGPSEPCVEWSWFLGSGSEGQGRFLSLRE